MELSLSDINDFTTKVEIFLTNIDYYQSDNMKYPDRANHHRDLINRIFSLKERHKIHKINCWKNTKEGKEYINCVAVTNGDTSDMYLYSEKDKRYYKYTIDEFAKMVDNGLEHIEAVWGLKQALSKLHKDRENNYKDKEVFDVEK